jgi:hypothetical protein
VGLPEKIYTERDLVRARRKSKAVGWLQGGGVVFGGAVILNIIGNALWWIPTILILAAIGYGLLRKASKKRSDRDVADL